MTLNLYGVAYICNGAIMSIVYGPYFNYTEAANKIRELALISHRVVQIQLDAHISGWELVSDGARE